MSNLTLDNMGKCKINRAHQHAAAFIQIPIRMQVKKSVINMPRKEPTSGFAGRLHTSMADPESRDSDSDSFSEPSWQTDRQTHIISNNLRVETNRNRLPALCLYKIIHYMGEGYVVA